MTYQYFTDTEAEVDHEYPLEKSWTTGLVFSSSADVVVRTELTTTHNTPVIVDWQFSWSGYLVPMSSASAPDPDVGTLQAGLQVKPNPTRGSTAISFSLDSAQDNALVAVYDVRGRRVRTLPRGPMGSGEHSIVWDGSNDQGTPVGDGLYFARLETPTRTEVQKLSRIR